MPIPDNFKDALRLAKFDAGRPGQNQVFDAFRSGKHVILHAPTGWGKTFAVVAALGEGHTVYSLPLRVLVDSLVRDANNFNLRRCAAHHGSRKEHAFLDRGDDPANPIECVFTTLDQSLSAYLGIPVGVSIRQGNILPAVIEASHLVFDEFHLFEPSRSWTTALLALRQSRQNGILLTATFSDIMVEFLVEVLGATQRGVELVQAPRPFMNIKIVRPGRGFASARELVLGERTIVIRNQIEWAKETAGSLRRDSRVQGRVYLLHSELLPEHRRMVETEVTEVFGKRGAGPAVLVATQVVEAGIDITCDVLHTDLCPPSSFIQRIGRCARFEGERGQIFIHPVESSSPYSGAEEEMKRLAVHFDKEKEITPEVERAVCNLSEESDRQAIARFRQASSSTVDQVRVERNYAAYAEMIRNINNVNVAIGTSPEQQYRFISVAQSKFQGSGTYAGLPATFVEIDFDRKVLRRVARTTEKLRGSDFILLDPDAIGYEPEVGFMIGEPRGEQHFLDSTARTRRRNEYTQEHAEPYHEHLETLMKYRPVCQWMVERLADHVGGLERANYLADFVIWAHDLGKLNVAWQRAHGVPENRVPIAHSGRDFPRQRQPPAHAWVSAWSVRRFLWDQLLIGTRFQHLHRPVFWALADHHGYSLNQRQRESFEPYRLGFLGYLDAMADAEAWRGKNWNRTILEHEVRASDVDEVFRFMEQEHLQTRDATAVYYMLSYILRRSDQLATAEVSTTIVEEITPHSPTNFA
jgi:CRISPR-associated endonuclease/helicase Cas3